MLRPVPLRERARRSLDKFKWVRGHYRHDPSPLRDCESTEQPSPSRGEGVCSDSDFAATLNGRLQDHANLLPQSGARESKAHRAAKIEAQLNNYASPGTKVEIVFPDNYESSQLYDTIG